MQNLILFSRMFACLVFLCAGTVFAQADAGPGQTTRQVETTQDGTVRETTTTVREKTTIIRETEVEQKTEGKTRLAAIFIKNRAGKTFEDKLGAFEDLVIGEITDMGFRVMSPEDTVKAVRGFLGTKPDETVPGAKLDELLDNNTSATRLAQNMGVDYLVIASITTFGKNTQHLKRPDLGVDRHVTEFTLRTSYKILDAGRGDSISAGNITSSKKLQVAEGFEESGEVSNELLADAATQIAGKLQAKGGAAGVADSRKKEAMVDFTVTCSMQDLSIPEVVKDKDGNYIMTGNRYNLEALSVTVELDGVVIGTAPGTFQALPGLHKIRLSREGFDEWERTINIRDGQMLNVALTLSDKGRKNWMEMAKFFENLKRGERMSEADAELVRGMAQMMRQSGYRVDRKVDIKVDTTEAPSVNQTNVDQQNVAQTVWP